MSETLDKDELSKVLVAVDSQELERTLDKNADTLASIIRAIESHYSIAFKYCKDLDFSGVRTVQPHNVYWNKDNNIIMLDAVQIEGDSKSGIKTFKQFDTMLIKDCIILADTFSVHTGYNSKSVRYNNSILGIQD
jgi:hypothetical protein